ncbi:MAG: hypothetical protein FWG64_01955 [Firmicutes bacterium]|nr:hypothetical protein [Bacillota bacterium]
MKYTMRIYCETPNLPFVWKNVKTSWRFRLENGFINKGSDYFHLVELESDAKEMEREIEQLCFSTYSYDEITFESWEKLLQYVQKNNYLRKDFAGTKLKKQRDLQRFVNLPGAIGNHILDAIMLNSNEYLRHKVAFKRVNWRTAEQFYYVGYLFKDEYGKTLDLRDYIAEIYTFDLEEYQRLLHVNRQEESEMQRKNSQNSIAKRNRRADKRREKVETFYKPYIGTYKNPPIMREWRANSADEHKPYIRNKRQNIFRRVCDDVRYLRNFDWSWKRLNKVRRQWAVNLPNHAYTLPLDWLDDWFAVE